MSKLVFGEQAAEVLQGPCWEGPRDPGRKCIRTQAMHSGSHVTGVRLLVEVQDSF